MKNKQTKLLLYVLPLLLISLFTIFGITSLSKSESLVVDSELTTYDVDKLLESGTVYSKNYFNLNKKYDNVEVAASSNFTVSTSGDLVTLYRPNVQAFLVNTVSSYNSSKYITNVGGVKSGNYGYLSLPNGTYYFYSYDLNGMSLLAKGPVNITSSCSNEVKNDQTSTFTVQRCYLKYSNGSVAAESTGTIGTCASGYKMSGKQVTGNGCNSIQVQNGLTRRYCKVTIQATCVKNDTGGGSGGSTGGGSGGTGGSSGGSGGGTKVATPSLTSAYVSVGNLSPEFKSSTYSYNVSVPATTTSIAVSGTPASGSSFVSGFSSRTVDLNYGNNVVQLKVQNSKGKVITYTFNIDREDNRSTVNTLSNLTVSKGTLTPAFSSTETEYSVEVENGVENITIDATVTDSKSSFVAGSGPGTYELVEGPNKLYIKVTSESGNTMIYTISVNRQTTPTECTTNPEDYALLKDIQLSVDLKGIEVDQIEDFDSKVFNYNGIKVNYKVTNLKVEAFALDDADAENITVENADDLKVGVPKLITIKIKSNHCTNIVNEYTVEVTRQPEVTLSTNAELDDITIEGYDIDFSKEKEYYGIKLKKGDDKLNISYKTSDEKASCTIEGNEDLRVGSQVKIHCLAEDPDTNPQDYYITIDGVEKGTNVFLIIIVVLGIIIFLVYLLLKLLGYKVVLNVGVVGAFFRGIGEKIKNIFDK